MSHAIVVFIDGIQTLDFQIQWLKIWFRKHALYSLILTNLICQMFIESKCIWLWVINFRLQISGIFFFPFFFCDYIWIINTSWQLFRIMKLSIFASLIYFGSHFCWSFVYFLNSNFNKLFNQEPWGFAYSELMSVQNNGTSF